jgi:arylsulfatase A-like enzyme
VGKNQPAAGLSSHAPCCKLRRFGCRAVLGWEFSSEYLTTFLTDDALRFINGVEDGKPWFLFLSYNAPHTPMEATEQDLAVYSHIKNPGRRMYAAMMHSLDVNVGRLIDHLASSGMRKDTLVVFLSDNGGATNNSSWNGELSGAKGTLREGGVRVPFFVSWPDGLPAGLIFEKPVSALDLLPTFLAAAGAEPLPLRRPMSHEDAMNFNRGVNCYGEYDGLNLLPVLRGQEALPKRSLFWRLQGQAAVMRGADQADFALPPPCPAFSPR